MKNIIIFGAVLFTAISFAQNRPIRIDLLRIDTLTTSEMNLIPSDNGKLQLIYNSTDSELKQRKPGGIWESMGGGASYTFGTGLTKIGGTVTVTNPFEAADEIKLDGIATNATVGADWNTNLTNIPANLDLDGSGTAVTAGTSVTVTGNGTAATPYVINSTDNQTAEKVPFTPTSTILSTNVQDAIEEFRQDAIIKGFNYMTGFLAITDTDKVEFTVSPLNDQIYLSTTESNLLLGNGNGASLFSGLGITLFNTGASGTDGIALNNGISLTSSDNIELTARDNDLYVPTITMDNIGVRSPTQWEAFDNVVEPDSTLFVTVGYLNSKLGGGGTSGTASEVAITDTANNFTATNVEDALAELANSGGITDGDKGDINVSSLGTTWNIDVDAVNSSKIQDESITGTDILDGTIQNNDIAANGILADRLNTTNAPVDNYILTSDITSSGFTWVDPASLSGTDDRTAAEVPIADVGGNFTATNVEDALAELATDTSTWTNIPLQNGIVHFPGFATPQYKINNGRVWLKGTVRNTSGSTLTNPVTMATFPVVARPQERMLIGVISNLTLQRLDVNIDGLVRLFADLPDGAWVQLDNISFPIN